MSRNGSGSYSLPAGNPVITGTTISSTWANTTLNDIANALTGSVASDGQTPMTGNLAMGGNNITNVGSITSTSLTDSGLTAGRITYASTGGLLADSSALTYNGTTVTSIKFAGAFNGSLGATTPSTAVVTSLTNSALTSGRVTYAGTSGLLSDSANLTWDNGNTRLGIGNSSPRSTLDITGSVLVNYSQTSSNYATLNVKTTSSITTPSTFTNAINIWNGTNVGEYSNITFGYNSIGLTYAPAYFGFVSTSTSGSGKGDLVFGTRDVTTDTAATERMRLDSSGTLLLGTTSATSNQQGLVVTTPNTTNKLVGTFINASSAGPYGVQVTYSALTPNGTGNEFLITEDSTARRFYVVSNGGIYNYSANNGNLSDRREKTNFAPATSYLDKICAIPVQTFHYIDQNLEEDDGLTLGVVAQDVQAVAPELVKEIDWAKKGDEPKMRLSIYQTDLQYALMKCIQEQQELIKSLTNRLTILENK